MTQINSMQDFIEVVALNVGGFLLYWATNMIFLPSTVYETVTWIVGTCVGVSLIALNVVKLYYTIKKGGNKTIDP